MKLSQVQKDCMNDKHNDAMLAQSIKMPAYLVQCFSSCYKMPMHDPYKLGQHSVGIALSNSICTLTQVTIMELNNSKKLIVIEKYIPPFVPYIIMKVT